MSHVLLSETPIGTLQKVSLWPAVLVLCHCNWCPLFCCIIYWFFKDSVACRASAALKTTASFNTSIGQRRSDRWMPHTYMDTWYFPQNDRRVFEQINCQDFHSLNHRVLVYEYFPGKFWIKTTYAAIGSSPSPSSDKLDHLTWDWFQRVQTVAASFTYTLKCEIKDLTILTKNLQM